MKLIEIEDIIVGQIWENKFKQQYVACFSYNFESETFFACEKYELGNLIKGFDRWYVEEDENPFNHIVIDDYEESKLIGFLNITHIIENNKLVEIPREEFEVDDIVCKKENIPNIAVLTGKEDLKNGCFKEVININNPFFIQDIKLNKYSVGNEENITVEFLDKNGKYGGMTYFISQDYVKIGTLGINYEWVNDKLIIKE